MYVYLFNQKPMTMSRYIITVMIALFPIVLFGQGKSKVEIPDRGCESYPGLVDSLYAYDWDKELQSWKAVSIRIYESSQGRYDRLLFINPDTRVPIRAWDYYYDSYGNRNLEISSAYRNNSWIINLRKTFDFDQNNVRLSETRHYFKQEKWDFVSLTYFEYLNGFLSAANYQEPDLQGQLFTVSRSEYSYVNGRLSEVTGYDGSEQSITGIERYFYDSETNRLTERVFWSYESTGNSHDVSMLKPQRRQLYFYDDLLMLREQLFQEYKDGEWVSYHRYEYFYKLDTSKKVTICHNNQTICISVNALKAHLAHGDKLGPCPTNVAETNKDRKREERADKTPPFIIFPNPVNDYFTVRVLNQTDSEIYKIEIIDPYGKLVKSYNTHNQYEVTITRENLRSGRYTIRLTGKEVHSTGLIFK